MLAIFMMTRVCLRSLPKPFEPPRRSNVDVLKNCGDRAIEPYKCRGLRIETEYSHRDNHTHKSNYDHFNWMRERKSGDIHALRTVMQLMHSPPEKIKAMLGAMNPVIDQLPNEKSNDEPHPYAELSAGQQAMCSNPFVRKHERQT